MTKANVPSRVDADVLDVLQAVRCDGDRVYLPPRQLERGLYMKVNEVLERLGGQWQSGKVKAHVFADDPAALLAECLATGIMPARNPLAFFATPAVLAARMVALLPADATRILEPSAGDGAILREIVARFGKATIIAVEADHARVVQLCKRFTAKATIIEDDFLRVTVAADGAAMNPPFAVARDPLEYIAHIVWAWDCLTLGGTLLAIAPAGLRFRTDRRTAALRALIEQHGHIEDLPAGTFEVSGTAVATLLVYMQKARD